MKQTDEPPISKKPLADGAGHTFFKILNRAGCLRVMPGTGRQLAITHGAQFPAQRLAGDDDAEFLENPLAEIDDPPPHDPCTAGIGPLAMIATRAARCASLRRGGCPGALRSIRPAGPCALNLTTQSRTI